MNDKQKKVRREQSLIAEHIDRVLDLPLHNCYSLAGKWRKLFGASLCQDVLSSISAGRNAGYLYQVLKNEYLKKSDVQNPIILNLADNWSDDDE